MRQDCKIAIEPIDDGDRLRMTVYDQFEPGKWSVLDIIEGPFVFIMQRAINEFDKDSDLRVHRRKHFRKDGR